LDEMLTVAAVVVFIATTPTWLDVWQVWHHPEKFDGDVDVKRLRAAIVIWYALLIIVALSAWRVLA